ncbi:hypothetical protein Y032_0172g365 [Ancylostoma ceylanicum]|uniref:Uncharacterized protein n=1 Tax=Ancylostoma ceylanicum TaxID=53326 RepID=A0A016SVF9_9BILA|nr:hypothetical protein Y032_0172g365 [Ancylostoma ceylanicum]
MNFITETYVSICSLATVQFLVHIQVTQSLNLVEYEDLSIWNRTLLLIRNLQQTAKIPFMPPSMHKSEITSVRERVLAIERSQATENSIIRARYVPDVRGVNRYKHFHVVNSTVKQRRHDEQGLKEASELPQLSRSTRCRAPRHIVVDSDDNGVEKGRRNKKQILPQLGAFPTLPKTQKEKDICDYIEQQAKAALTSSDSLSSSTTTRSTHSGRKLHDHLSMSHQQQNTPRTFASLGGTKIETTENGATEGSIGIIKQDEGLYKESSLKVYSENEAKSDISTKETATQTVVS